MSILLTAIMLSACSQSSDEVSSAQAPMREFSCKEPLPFFTLGPNSNPSDAEVGALCSCIWENLGTWERETATLIAGHKESEVSALNMAAFPARFGSAIEKCGGTKL
jgi:hypothetical protein